MIPFIVIDAVFGALGFVAACAWVAAYGDTFGTVVLTSYAGLCIAAMDKNYCGLKDGRTEPS